MNTEEYFIRLIDHLSTKEIEGKKYISKQDLVRTIFNTDVVDQLIDADKETFQDLLNRIEKEG